MNKLILLTIMSVSLVPAMVYLRFGELSPCEILNKKIQSTVVNEITSKMSNETGSTLATIVGNRLTQKFIETLSPTQCIELFFNVEKIKKMLYEAKHDLNN